MPLLRRPSPGTVAWLFVWRKHAPVWRGAFVLSFACRCTLPRRHTAAHSSFHFSIPRFVLRSSCEDSIHKGGKRKKSKRLDGSLVMKMMMHAIANHTRLVKPSAKPYILELMKSKKVRTKTPVACVLSVVGDDLPRGHIGEGRTHWLL